MPVESTFAHQYFNFIYYEEWLFVSCYSRFIGEEWMDRDMDDIVFEIFWIRKSGPYKLLWKIMITAQIAAPY